MAYLEVVTPQAFTNTAGLLAIPDITSDLVLDFDADSITGVADDAVITSWTSRGANQITLASVGSPGVKPQLQLAEVNGHAAVSFNGGQHIRSANTTDVIFAAGVASTRVLVYKPTAAVAGTRVSTGTAAGSGFRLISDNSAKPSAMVGSPSVTVESPVAGLNQWIVAVARYTSSQLRLSTSLSVTPVASTVTAMGPHVGVTIGSAHNNASFFTGLVARQLDFGREFSDAEVSAIIDVMCGRYGITRVA